MGACAFGEVIPLRFDFRRLIHGNESLGKKSTTPKLSVLTPRVAAIIDVLALTIAAILAACSQCEPNGSHW
jgi:hypothetical protein